LVILGRVVQAGLTLFAVAMFGGAIMINANFFEFIFLAFAALVLLGFVGATEVFVRLLQRRFDSD